jgi:broad specificity phosphatase PhoE
VQSGLDEYDLKGFIEHLAPALANLDPHFAKLIDASKHASTEPHERLRSFQLMFGKLLLYWQSERTHLANVESWTQFRQRVESSIREIQRNALQGCRVAIVTSGGFIGTATQTVLGSPDRIALELNWRVLNSSLTEFVFDQDRMTLDRFNAVPHLPDRALWTYR